MAKVTFSIEFPSFTVQDLIDLVVAYDIAESGDEEPIKPEFVKGYHVLGLYFTGELPIDGLVVNQGDDWEHLADNLHMDDKGNITTGNEKILINTMEES